VIVLLLLAGLAHASDRADWRLWSWTSVEGVPSADGTSDLRAEEQLGLSAASAGWDVSGIAAVRRPAAGDPVATVDLLNLRATRAAHSWSVSAGRIVRVDGRGLQRLDGLELDLGTGTLGATLWGGRAWHPEQWAVGDAWLGGGLVQFNPNLGDAPFAFRARAGTEMRMATDGLVPRLNADLGAWGAMGRGVSASAELQPGEGARADLRGTARAGALDLGGAARWEGLAPAIAPEAIDNPMTWLAGDGYAAVDARLGARVGQFGATVTATPTLHPGDDGMTTGGLGRAQLTWAPGAATVGAAAIAASLGDESLAGGIGELRLRAGSVTGRCEAGVFGFRPLDLVPRPVWESRVGADVVLMDDGPAGAVTLTGYMAAGGDRVLMPWVRGGALVRASMGSAR
jgi:hypothetical protein